MSDAFADLWSSSPPPQKPSLRQLPTSSNPSSRPITPSSNALFNHQPPHTNAPNYNRPIRTQSLAQHAATPKDTSGDPFGSLLSGSLASSGVNGGSGRLTMAEMAARAQQQRSDKVILPRSTQSMMNGTGSDSLWAGLDSLGASSHGSSPAPAKTIANNSLLDDEGDWGFDPTPSAPLPPPQELSSKPIPDTIVDLADTFGFSDISSEARPPPATLTSKSSGSSSGLVWDTLDSFEVSSKPQSRREPSDDGLDDLGFGLISSQPPSRPTASSTTQRADSPSEDFNFGNYEYADAPSTVFSGSSGSRAPSPPPHILGQLVEMGFMPEKAKAALMSTYNPSPGSVDARWDVEGTVAYLLSAGRSASHTPEPARSNPPDYHHSNSRGHRRPKLPPRADSAHSTSAASSSSRSLRTDSTGQNGGDLLTQASEIGLSMFNRANAFWNAKGKEMKDKVVERVVKVYEETAGARNDGSSNRTGSGQGRPRWMQDAGDHVDGADMGPVSFKDFDGEEEAPPRRPAQPHQDMQQTQRPAVSEVDLLFSETPVTAYVSPFRRGKLKPASTVNPPAASTSSLPPRQSTPPPPQARPSLVSCSYNTLAQSTRYKSQGTECFKLGQYAEAHSAYTRAIEVLPPGHVCRVPLYNNRALASSRTGDVKGAMLDSGRALQIICGIPEANDHSGLGDLDPTSSSAGPFTDRSKLSFDPRKEAKITTPEEGSEVDLGGMWIKASKRRAEAFEGMEKWAEAKQDWEMILSAGDWVGEGTRREAVGAIGRCKRMLEGGSRQPIPSSDTAKPISRPTPRRPALTSDKPSAALTALRVATDQAEAEANQKHELKDAVDAKLIAWKGGKEANIRALVASLDTVLWPELGWKKVGMGELVTENQVKIRYMRAISKVHPDKITTSNTTLEQRMIANGIFGVLNEAWNAFKT